MKRPGSISTCIAAMSRFALSPLLPGRRGGRCLINAAQFMEDVFGPIVFAFLLSALPTHAATPRVVAWGAGVFVSHPPDYNNYGQSIVPNSPTNALTNATHVAGGWRHSLGIKADGTLQAWGDDTIGQTDFWYEPTNCVSIACGRLHSLALQQNGFVIPAGDDTFGQVEIPDNLSNVVAISAGFYHSVALRSDGTVVAWGTSTNIQNIGTDPNYGQPVVPSGLSNVVAVAAGGWHTLALKSDGTLRAWGRNDSGQSSIPSGLSNVVAIGAGATHNLILKSDGTLFSWGLNTYGQTNIPSNLTNVVAIVCGGWHNLALKSDGTVVAWGAGSPVVNTNVDCGQDIVPPGLSNVVQIAAGSVHSLALVGSNPPVTRALLKATSAANAFDVTFPAQKGRVYRLEYKDHLNDTNWLALPLVAGQSPELRLTDRSPPAARRFYRVQSW